MELRNKLVPLPLSRFQSNCLLMERSRYGAIKDIGWLRMWVPILKSTLHRRNSTINPAVGRAGDTYQARSHDSFVGWILDHDCSWFFSFVPRILVDGIYSSYCVGYDWYCYISTAPAAGICAFFFWNVPQGMLFNSQHHLVWRLLWLLSVCFHGLTWEGRNILCSEFVVSTFSLKAKHLFVGGKPQISIQFLFFSKQQLYHILLKYPPFYTITGINTITTV